MANIAPKLLVVDDAADDRDVIGRRLSRDGFEVVEASSGEAALDLLDKYRFDLVLLDINMPGLSGLEVLKRLRGKWPETELPVIMVTGSDDKEHIATARQLSASGFLTKPVQFPLASQTVHARLNFR